MKCTNKTQPMNNRLIPEYCTQNETMFCSVILNSY